MWYNRCIQEYDSQTSMTVKVENNFNKLFSYWQVTQIISLNKACAYPDRESSTKVYIPVMLGYIGFLADKRMSLWIHCNGISEKPENKNYIKCCILAKIQIK